MNSSMEEQVWIQRWSQDAFHAGSNSVRKTPPQQSEGEPSSRPSGGGEFHQHGFQGECKSMDSMDHHGFIPPPQNKGEP